MRMGSFVVFFPIIGGLALGGCSSGEPASPPLAAPPPSAPAPSETIGSTSQALVSNTDVFKSLLVRDGAIVSAFSLQRVFGRLLQTTATALRPGESLDPGETDLVVFRRWWATFGRATPTTLGCDSPGIDPEGYGLAGKCPRTFEANLFVTNNPFLSTSPARVVPIALVNRFDLTPSSGATCGEARIVYQIVGAALGARGRGTLNFAAAVPNPRPSAGLDGCLPVARFWQSLSDDPDVASRKAKLEAFFFTGSAEIPAIVDARNFGFVGTDGVAAIAGRPGQVEFDGALENDREWHLREHRLRAACPTSTTCQLQFEHIVAPANPAEELFAGTHPKAASFRAELVTQVSRLARPSLDTITMTTSSEFNQYESSSEAGGGIPSSDVRFKGVADGAMRTAIATELTRLGSPLTVDNILDRATTQTCGGCHRQSNNVNLGGGLVWPASNGFTHIQSGQVSPALVNVFLPRRKQILEAFINRRIEGPETLGYVCHP
ncbi:MAG: hypothetical protein JST00_00765 [Deltaproteobacteria bacterium]|nr:hypothetical protein [Deltaproteobacteria bacterium]